eukprot:EG_transcript_30083
MVLGNGPIVQWRATEGLDRQEVGPPPRTISLTERRLRISVAPEKLWQILPPSAAALLHHANDLASAQRASAECSEIGSLGSPASSRTLHSSCSSIGGEDLPPAAHKQAQEVNSTPSSPSCQKAQETISAPSSSSCQCSETYAFPPRALSRGCPRSPIKLCNCGASDRSTPTFASPKHLL